MTSRPQAAAGPGGQPRVVVLTRDGCHLCETACEVVAGVCSETGDSWRSLDLDELDDAERLRWADFIPVVRVDGEVHDVFRVEPARLRAALAVRG